VIAVLAVSLALAVIACVWLGARTARQGRELATTQAAVTVLEADAAAAAERQAALEAETETAKTAMADLERRALDADSARTAAEQDLTTAREAAAAAEAQAADAEARAEAADERAEAAEEAARQAAEELAADAPGPGWTGGPGPEVLWALELARTERTWRTSVAADPTAETFDRTSDPLRQAVEVDVAALREEVGVEFTVAWELDSTLEPVAALAVLRGAQELLAAATRVTDEAVVAVGHDGDDVTIRMTAPDGPDPRFTDLGNALAGAGVDLVDGGIRILGAARDVPS
jgi:pyruvate/2-oxoglutarate dehydrogenase complex dihydrolipoamide acyltransferase (E2) component